MRDLKLKIMFHISFRPFFIYILEMLKSSVRTLIILGFSGLSFGTHATCMSTMPLASPQITSNFGLRKHPVFHDVRPHWGTDFHARVPTPLYAVHGGLVVTARMSGSAGNLLIITGNDGLNFKYMHLDRFFVHAGDVLIQGQQLGLSGGTGAASAGPHLHFETIPTGSVASNNAVDSRQFFCTSVPQQSTAGPNMALNPNGMPPGTTGSAGVPPNPMPTTPPVGGPSTAGGTVDTIKQASDFGSYDNMSMKEFLENQSTRRFGNPQWYRDINDPLDELRNHPDPAVKATVAEIPIGKMNNMLWREILYMMTLKTIFQTEKRDRAERIEEMLAADLADRVSEYSTKLMNSLRANASNGK